MKTLALFVLGGFRLVLDGQMLGLDADKSRALLAYLALEGAAPQPRERLAALLWSDQPEEKALHSLRQTLSGLRKVLAETNEDPFLLVTREDVQLNPQSKIWVDALSFQRDMEQVFRAERRALGGGAFGGKTRLDICALLHAAEIYGGVLLDGISLQGSELFDEWLVIERERLGRKAIEAFTLLVEYHQRRGEFGRARELAEKLVRLAPWDENAHHLLIRLLAVDGQPSAALAQYQALNRYLMQEMGAEPTQELQILYQAIRHNEVVQPAVQPVARPHLPRFDLPFIGRSQALNELSSLMADPDCRLLTLLGAGGIGKTRLALEVLQAQVGLFADGVYFVGLTGVMESRLLASVLAEAIGYRFFGPGDFVPQLLNFLSGKEMLILLDNYEHLLPVDEQAEDEAMLLIGQILHQATGVKLLVTSRAPLNLRPECIFRVEGLDVGDGANEARLLFEQVARRIGINVQAERETVKQVCNLLQGSPLAIELAAAWTRSLSCTEILQQVRADLGFVSAAQRDALARHRSLRAVFDYSWTLLHSRLRVVLQSLSVFQGGFTMQAAAQVAEATMDDLQALTEWSLVQAVGDERLDLHSLVRQFAEEKLAEEPEEQENVMRRHAVYYASWLGERYPLLIRDEQLQILDAIGIEMENMRAAWGWAVANGDEAVLWRAVDGLELFLEMRSWYAEGERAFSALVTACEGVSDGLLAVAFSYQAVFELQLGKYAEAVELLERALPRLSGARLSYAWMVRARAMIDLQDQQAIEVSLDEALRLSRETGRLDVEAMALLLRGHATRALGQYDDAESDYQQSLMIYRSLGDRWGIAKNLGNLAILAGGAGRHAEAMRYLEESLILYRQLGDRAGIARSLHNISNVVYLMEDFERALLLRQECLRICREIGFRWGVASTLKHLGDVEKVLGHVQVAQEHYQEALSLADQLRSKELRVSILNSLGNLLLLKKTVGAARRIYGEALQLALETAMTPVGVDVLVGLAETFVEGECDEQPLGWLEFAVAFQGSDQQTRDKAKLVLGRCTQRLTAERVMLLQQQSFEVVADEALKRVQGS